MQDRFKFRAFGHSSKKMISIVDLNARDFYYGIFVDNRLLEHYFGKGPYTIMQCTSLRDKNGKLIYEGDIVEAITHNPYEKHIGVIQFHSCYFSLDYIKLGKYGQSGISLAKNTADLVLLKIIGNIYENPELLEKGA